MEKAAGVYEYDYQSLNRKTMKRIVIAAMIALVAMQALALNVENRAGDLSQRVTDLNATSLVVTGTMDARDFYFIVDKMKKLSSIDLTGVQVVSCPIIYQRYWQDGFAADEVPVGAFAGMNVTSVKLPTSLKSIGEAAFTGCVKLTNVGWPASLDSIGDYAFAGCTSLVSVTLPASVRVVGKGAYMHCSSLRHLGVKSGSLLQRLDATALLDCPLLTTVSLGANAQMIGERALVGTAIEQLDLSASKQLTTIGDEAFVMMPLTSAVLPASVTTVGEGAFLGDKQLTQVNLGGHVKELNNYLLAETSLNDAGLDLNGMTRIGDYALYNVSTMSVVELPATMTWLGSYAMAGMTGMTELTCNAVEVPALGSAVWAGVNQKAIPLTVPAESKESYQVANQWKNFLFEVSWLRGDVNNDGEVNIADVNTLIDIILGGKFDAMTMLRADVNGDGEIGIADINEVQDIILTASSHAPAVVDTDDQLHIDDVMLRPGEQRTIKVTVDQAEDYSALQCDLMLPQGLSLVEVRSARGHKMVTHDMGGATTRLLMYSMDKASLDENAALVLTVVADDALAAESQITVSNIVLADDSNTGWHLADCTARVANSSGIEDLNADSDRLWVEGQTLCIESRNDGEAQVVAVNGMSHSILVGDGVTRYSLEPGYYVVILNGKSHKIAIR